MDDARTRTDMPTMAPPLEAPAARSPAIHVPVGMLQPIATLPIYQRCETRSDLDILIDEDIIAGQMVPKSFFAADGNPSKPKIRIAIMNGRELGYSALFSIQHQAVINGIPSWYGDVPLGRVYVSGLMTDFEETLEGLNDLNEHKMPKNPTAVCRVVRRGIPTPIVRRFSWTDAETAGLTVKAGPWQEYYFRMLQLRARSFALRDGFADVLMGMRIAEEHFSARHWERNSGGGHIIDVEPEVAASAAPPRPKRPAAKSEPKPEPEPTKTADPVVISDLYPLYDEFGNEATTQFPSGDWLDRAADYVGNLMKLPGNTVRWFENNDTVLLELTEKLGFDETKALLEMKVAAEAALEALASKPPQAEPVAQAAPQPDPARLTPPDGDEAPPAPAALAPRPFFLLKNHKDEEVAQCKSAADYDRATSWLSRAADNLTPESRGKLYGANREWLQEADKAGAVPAALKEKIFPAPAAPKQDAVAPSRPVSTVPPPPPAPVSAPPAAAPVPSAPPPVPPAAAAPPPTPAPEVEKKPAPRKKKDTADDPAASGAALDEKHGLKAVEWKPEMKGTSAFFVALQADIKRLQAAAAPPEAFARLHELNKPGLDLYKDGMKAWAEGLERTLVLNAAPRRP